MRGEQMTGARPDPQPQRYEICIRGRLGETIRSAFPALRAKAQGGNTILTGVLPDQAALYGVLAEAEALGLELIELRRLPLQEPRDRS
jgi:hypothetical protein